MSIESFVNAMPKIEINLQLEGAILKDTLIVIAEQNDIPLDAKRSKNIMMQLDQPDYGHLDDLITEVSKWIQQPDDFTRIVYELGVSLAKQNVLYAEVGINPSLYMENGLTFEQLLTALNDGRERVQRAWNVQLRWVLNVTRNEPRKIDDVIKWASSAAATKGGVVGIGIVGQGAKGWLDQFERPFRTAQKKSLARSVQALEGAADIPLIVDKIEPERIFAGLSAVENDEAIRSLTDKGIVIGICMAYSVVTGGIGSYAEFPLRRLVDDGASVTLCAGMPSLYRTSLVQEYLAAVEHAGLSIQELEQICLNTVQASFLPDETKASMQEEFTKTFETLREEHSVTLDTTV